MTFVQRWRHIPSNRIILFSAFHSTRPETVAWSALRNDEICHRIVNEIKRLNEKGRENLEDFQESRAAYDTVCVAE